jgi:hypothetical protein
VARKKPEKKEKNPAVQDGTVRKVGDARALLTVEQESALWDPDRRCAVSVPRGAIVRLRPPATATDDDVARVRDCYEKLGAERVSVLPRPKAEVVPARVAREAPARAESARAAVLALVEEANTKDRATLRSLCEMVMAEVGL